MDKDFEKKVKRKRLRVIAVILIVVALAVYLILDMNVEKADYSDSLQDQIKTAQELLSAQRNNAGNEKGQYAQYTLLAFERQIKSAEQISKSEDSEYNDKKEAYEALKDQTKEFKNAENGDVVEQSVVEKLAASKEVKEYTTEIKDKKEMTYTLDGANVKKPVTINLTAKEEGPYYEQINAVSYTHLTLPTIA